ncbi:MAG: alpha/beta fold hydrolase [Bacteroidia bacterium]
MSKSWMYFFLLTLAYTQLRWRPGDEGFYAWAPEKGFLRYTDKVDTLFPSSAPMEKLAVEEVIPLGERRFLLLGESQALFRRSVRYQKAYLYRLPQAPEKLALPYPITTVAPSPKNQYLAFCHENDLFVMKWGSAPTPITQNPPYVQSGRTDWLYEEEFGFTQAYAFSPSETYVAYLTFDNRQTARYPLVHYGEKTYPTLQELPYPKAGQKNPIVSLHLLDLAQGKTKCLWTDSVGGYLPFFAWSPHKDTLFFAHLNRSQNLLTLHAYAPAHQKTWKILRDSTPTYFSLDNRSTFYFLPDKELFTYLCDKSGIWQLDLYTYEGKKLRTLPSPGPVQSVLKANKKALYFTAYPSPLETHLYRLDLKNFRLKPLTTPGKSYEAQIAGAYLKLEFSSAHMPTQTWITLLEKPGSPLHTWEEERLLSYQKTLFSWVTPRGDTLHAYRITPPNWDSTRRHSALVLVYGGPGVQMVKNAEGSMDLLAASLAQRGILVFATDNRGTPGRFRAFETATYKKLGLAETQDQADFLQYLRSLPYIQKDKIAVWGWSYGGFMAARLALLHDSLIACAFSGAPVTSWDLYDSAYTERFMDTPQNNPSGYQETNLLSKARKIHCHLVFFHGTYDDNVHVQNTLLLVKKLLETGSKVDWRIYPDMQHGAGKYFSDVWQTTVSYLDRLGFFSTRE